jgi:hypothetical protein
MRRGELDPTLGTSFFKPRSGLLDYSIRTPFALYKLVTNALGEFSGASSRLRANSIGEASSIFLRGIVPFLDHISYIANVPLIIERVQCTDEKNAVQSFAYTTPYMEVAINPHESFLHYEMMPVYALFREAKNAESPIYRFRCYYKILEGIFRHLRPQLYRVAKEKSISLTSMREVIPDESHIRVSYPDIIGRPIQEYFERDLTSDFRDPAAHFILDPNEFLSISDPVVTNKYIDILWPAEICCRTVIAQQEQYFTQFQKLSSNRQ